MENQAKTCKECGKLLTLDHYRIVPLSPDRHANICKECAKIKRRQKRDKFAPVALGGGIRNLRNSRLVSLSRSCVAADTQAN